jgi:transcriptional regulator NrdR family protein
MINVIKRDGLEENFDKNKIAKVLIAAGLNSQEALNIAQTVSDWVNSLGKLTIKSSDIANEVIEKLKKTNPYIADLFAWYEKTKTKVK